jgi:ABC-2 type transport system ATP-binding protein
MMSDNVVEAHGLTKYFGREKVVDTLDLTVPRGTVYGFLGRNGSGKTTTIRMLLGLLHATRGCCSLLGCDSEELTPAIKTRVGYLAEGHHLIDWMSIGKHADFLRSYYETWDQAWFNEMIDRFHLDLKKKISSLSRGQRAQVALAFCLAPRPELLVLDDPTLGLDPVVRYDVLESIIETIQGESRTVLFSSHNLADVERVADRIGIIEAGILRADCSLAAFKNSVRRIRCLFRNGHRPELALPGLLRVRWLQNEARVTLAHFEESRLDELKDLGADDVEVLDASLEELFMDYTAPLSGRN